MKVGIRGLTPEEIETMKSSKTEADWNRNCDAVKRARSGQYPPDWYDKIILSGVAALAQKGFTS